MTPASPAPPATRRSYAERERGGLLSAVDGRGDRLIWLTCPTPSRAILLVAAHVNEPAGLRDLRTSEVSRRRLRDARENLQRETGLRLVEAPFEVLDALVMEAWERGHAEERRCDYPTIRARLTRDPPLPPAEPMSSRVGAADDTAADALLRGSAALLEEPELRSWWPDPAEAAEVVGAIEALDASPIVLSDGAKTERLAQLVRDAARRLYPPALLARRLEGVAYVLAETRRPGAARMALAVAGYVRAHPHTLPDVPLVVTLVQQGLGRVLARHRATQTDPRRDALVVTPDELRTRSASRPRRTPG